MIGQLAGVVLSSEGKNILGQGKQLLDGVITKLNIGNIKSDADVDAKVAELRGQFPAPNDAPGLQAVISRLHTDRNTVQSRMFEGTKWTQARQQAYYAAYNILIPQYEQRLATMTGKNTPNTVEYYAGDKTNPNGSTGALVAGYTSGGSALLKIVLGIAAAVVSCVAIFVFGMRKK